MVEAEASSTVGAASGDSQVTWVTTSTTADMSNAHVATFDSKTALVTWEEIADPFCEYIAFGCQGTFTGANYQLVSSDGTLVGEPLVTKDVTVSGDLVTMTDGRICWPYVSQEWDLNGVVGWGFTSTNVTKMSFACLNADGTASTSGSSSTAASSVVASSSAAVTSSAEVAVAAAASTSSSATVLLSSSVAPASSAEAVSVAPAATTPLASSAQPATTLLTSTVSAAPAPSCSKHVHTVYVTAA